MGLHSLLQGYTLLPYFHMNYLFMHSCRIRCVNRLFSCTHQNIFIFISCCVPIQHQYTCQGLYVTVEFSVLVPPQTIRASGETSPARRTWLGSDVCSKSPPSCRIEPLSPEITQERGVGYERNRSVGVMLRRQAIRASKKWTPAYAPQDEYSVNSSV
jgi:hypothetical protein